MLKEPMLLLLCTVEFAYAPAVAVAVAVAVAAAAAASAMLATFVLTQVYQHFSAGCNSLLNGVYAINRDLRTVDGSMNARFRPKVCLHSASVKKTWYDVHGKFVTGSTELQRFWLSC